MSKIEDVAEFIRDTGEAISKGTFGRHGSVSAIADRIAEQVLERFEGDLAIVPEGSVVVPREPSEEMLNEGMLQANGHIVEPILRRAWDAMIEASEGTVCNN